MIAACSLTLSMPELSRMLTIFVIQMIDDTHVSSFSCIRANCSYLKINSYFLVAICLLFTFTFTYLLTYLLMFSEIGSIFINIYISYIDMYS